MKLKIFFLAFVFLCGPVFAETAYFDKNTGYSFPVSIADFGFNDKNEYGDAELGYGLNYWYKNEVLITVIVYNMGIDGIKNGIKGTHVLSQHGQANTDVGRAVDAGHYKSAKEISVSQDLSSHFLRSSFDIVRRDDTHVRSHLFLRGQDGYFIKVRASGKEVEDFDKKVAEFLEQLFVIVSPNKY